MTYGEVLDLEGEHDRQLWDERWWLFALKSDNSIETYQKIIEEKGEAPPDLESLPPERQRWYREA